MAQETEPKPVRSDQVTLAQERTFLAHERTLMAWIRTAASLITFGFTLFKFFEYLTDQDLVHTQERLQTHAQQHLLGARTYGMAMIVIGVVTLALATWQHRIVMKRLRAQYPEAPFSLALLLAALISGLGILALIATVYRG
jgi:putative membrane protein